MLRASPAAHEARSAPTVGYWHLHLPDSPAGSVTIGIVAGASQAASRTNCTIPEFHTGLNGHGSACSKTARGSVSAGGSRRKTKGQLSMRMSLRHAVKVLAVAVSIGVGGCMVQAVGAPFFQDQGQDHDKDHATDYSKNKTYQQGVRDSAPRLAMCAAAQAAQIDDYRE